MQLKAGRSPLKQRPTAAAGFASQLKALSRQAWPYADVQAGRSIVIIMQYEIPRCEDMNTKFYAWQDCGPVSQG